MRNKQNRKKTIVLCNNCKKQFEKATSEVKRTEAKGGKHYCNRNCCGKGNFSHNLKNHRFNGASHLREYNNRDEYTGFREFIRRARSRNKLGNLTLEDLKKQWEMQKGICPYTGTILKLPTSVKKYSLFELASLGRIDSSKLYEKDNVVFVSIPINYMKNSMSEEETIMLCKKIALFWKDK